MDTSKLMKIVNVEESNDSIVIVTTGARYILDKTGENGRIECCQLINKERLIAAIEFNVSFREISIEKKDETTCVMSLLPFSCNSAYVRIQVNKDSLLDIQSLVELKLKLTGDFMPEYFAEKDGHILLIDRIGGIGAYPYRGLTGMELVNTNRVNWSVSYDLQRSYNHMIVSLFPPREFNYKQSFEDRIYHRPFYVSDGELEEAKKYTNILVLHETIWQGKLTKKGIDVSTREEVYADASYCCFDYIPVDEDKLKRNISKAHSLDMKVIVYMSPYYSMAKGNDYIEQVKHVIDKYGVDGVYFDGNSNDIVESYERIKNVRAILGEGLLYVHCTSDPISSNIYCPFIDTYADYILRAEHITMFDKAYLRYVVSGYNISNSIGNICYSGYSSEFVEKLIEECFPAETRFYLGSLEGENESLIKQKYFPKLDSLYNEYKLENI